MQAVSLAVRDLQRVNDTGDEPQETKQDVDDNIAAAALLEEDAEGRKDDGKTLSHSQHDRWLRDGLGRPQSAGEAPMALT